MTTQERARRQLAKRKHGKTWTQLEADLGMSKFHLLKILHGERAAGPKLLRKLYPERTIEHKYAVK